MSDSMYIRENIALSILMVDGDYSESQARIILGHSLKQEFDGETYYPADYIAKRAKGERFDLSEEQEIQSLLLVRQIARMKTLEEAEGIDLENDEAMDGLIHRRS